MDSDDRSYNRTALAGTHRAVSSPPAKGKMSQLPDLSKIPPRVEPVKWNRRDALLYALGVGESNLNFVYELSPEFSILPTYPCVLRHKGDSFDIIDFFQRVNLTKVVVPGVKDAVGVHGEQLFEASLCTRLSRNPAKGPDKLSADSYG